MSSYRNVVDVISIQGVEIDEGHLWKLDAKKQILVLVDEDQYITSDLDEKKFNPEL